MHDAIINNQSVVVMVQSKSFCHYVLAVGFEYEKNDYNSDIITKVLCLDPDDDLDQSNYWNCVIDTKKELTEEYTCPYVTRKLSDKVRINNIKIIKY